jgi:hypothetical protein
MANEYLQRTPTSTGNRKVWTWAGWIKRNKIGATTAIFHQGVDDDNSTQFRLDSGNTFRYEHADASSPTDALVSSNVFRDVSNWCHFVVSVDTTQEVESNRIQIYFNGDRQTNLGTANYPTINFDTDINSLTQFYIGALISSGNYYNGEMSDVFFIDGQALTPDVFGFYKEGKGYISAGSTQATDFRPGQWVPKTPRVIKTEINRRGGFGVNGFYLPMNDSRNFGADFHGEPNSIITLNEKLPQPRVGVASTAAAGLGYTDVLRADPYAANLVLALPFVSSGLCTNGTNVGINTGFGDYSAIIKGSGSAKVGTLVGNVSIANTAAYYGSSGFFDGTDDRITFASSSDFNFGTGDFTVEFWANSNNVNSTGSPSQLGFFQTSDTAGGIKASYTGGLVVLQGAGPSGGGIGRILAKVGDSSVGTDFGILTTSQWNHIALARKSGTATLYVNGVAVGVNTTATESITGTNLVVGGYSSTSYLYQGYLQDFRVYNTAKYKGGFDVPKPYTPVGIATWRAVPDCTANNFATWNPISKSSTESSLGLTNGNLTATADASVNKFGTATVGVTTGKWYYEFSSTSANSYFEIGIGTYAGSAASSNGLNYKCYSGNIEIENVSQTTVSSLGANEILGIAFNASDGQTTFYKDGVGIATISFTSSSGLYIPQLQSANGATHVGSANFGQNPTFSGNVAAAGTFTDSNGKGLFKYEPPSGFLALCEDNLPTPAISDPGDYFKSVLYTGDGNSGRSITGIGFTPDLVWIKRRNGASDHVLQDSVRGFGSGTKLASSSTNSESLVDNGATDPKWGYLNSVSSDGFSLNASTNGDQVNLSGSPYVAWCWRAGAGTTSTNTNGSIQSVVSVNQTAGFSIVSYTGTSSAATVGHGLGKAPKFIIAKSRTVSGTNNVVYHSSLGGTNKVIVLNSTATPQTITDYWGSAAPTSTVFGVANGVYDNNNGNLIAYCWAEIEGFSKFGSFVANANSDGPFAYCGFKPAWLIVKNTTRAGGWMILDSSRDPVNVASNFLEANDTDAEASTQPRLDFVSNGFKVRAGSSYTPNDTSGDVYIFAAFAESPINYSNAK